MSTQQNLTNAEKPAQEATERKPYAAPRLRHLGSVRELTLGTTPGKGEIGGFRVMTM
jgi:hypothetical protein